MDARTAFSPPLTRGTRSHSGCCPEHDSSVSFASLDETMPLGSPYVSSCVPLAFQLGGLTPLTMKAVPKTDTLVLVAARVRVRVGVRVRVTDNTPPHL